MQVSSAGLTAVGAAFLQIFVYVTTVKSLGMMLVAMQDEFGSDTWVLGTIFAVVECVTDLLGKSLSKAYSPRLPRAQLSVYRVCSLCT